MVLTKELPGRNGQKFSTTSTELQQLIRSKQNLRREWRNIEHTEAGARKNHQEAKKCFKTRNGKCTSRAASLCRATKKLKRPVQNELPLRLANGNWMRSDTDKGAVFATYLQGVFQSNSPSSDPLLHKNKRRPQLRISESRAELPPIAIKCLIQLVNEIIQLGYFPRSWKTSPVTMILMAGKDFRLASSYRAISLLSAVS